MGWQGPLFHCPRAYGYPLVVVESIPALKRQPRSENNMPVCSPMLVLSFLLCMLLGENIFCLFVPTHPALRVRKLGKPCTIVFRPSAACSWSAILFLELYMWYSIQLAFCWKGRQI